MNSPIPYLCEIAFPNEGLVTGMEMTNGQIIDRLRRIYLENGARTYVLSAVTVTQSQDGRSAPP